MDNVVICRPHTCFNYYNYGIIFHFPKYCYLHVYIYFSHHLIETSGQL